VKLPAGGRIAATAVLAALAGYVNDCSLAAWPLFASTSNGA